MLDDTLKTQLASYLERLREPVQLIASLDVARRQAELEGYELVGRAIELSLILRREVNAAAHGDMLAALKQEL